jgi:hypothetical protein
MGRYQVKAPDGHVYEFEAPDDATPEQLDAMTREVAGYGTKYPVVAPHTGSPAPRQLGVGEQLLENTKNDLAGIVQGAAAIPDMAATGVGKALSLIPNAISQALSAAGHGDAAQWIQDNVTHGLANPVRVGDVVESAAPTPDTTEGHVDRFLGQMVGGAIGLPASAMENAAARIVGQAPKAVVPPPAPAAHVAAQAADDLGIDLPAFAVQGPKAAAKAVSKSKGGFGASDLGQSAEAAIEQSRVARDEIASKLAPPRNFDSGLGDEVSTAAADARTAERKRIGRLYESGDQIMGNTPIKLDQTKQAINSLIDQEDAALVPSAAAPVLKQLQAKIGNGGPMTAAAMRSSMQNIKSLMTSNNVDATTADHILNIVTDAMNGDITSAAKGTGAAKIYSDARSQWASIKQLEKTVLKPILGASFQNTGDQVARNLVTAAKTNGSRLGKMFALLPEDVANSARAALIMRLGTPADAAQNAAGDAYSLSEVLKNWNQLKGSRNLIFPKETVQALDKLARIAEQGKILEKVAANGATAQSSGLKQALHSAPLGIGAAASYISHDPKEIVLGMLATGLSALKQYRSARLLASPSFAKKLAATPLNARGAEAYWSRPWVKALAAKNPAIAAEIQAFQYHVLNGANDNVVSSAVASPETNGEDQQQ